MATRKELVEALRARYSSAPPVEKAKILDEFVALTGYHRKHAIRVLRGETNTRETRARNRLYDEAVRQALTVLWEAGDRVCGKRLKALIPMLVDAMERHGHLDLDPVVRTKVLQVSAATIDRILADARMHIDGKRRRRTGVGAAIRRSIPVRTFANRVIPSDSQMVRHFRKSSPRFAQRGSRRKWRSAIRPLRSPRYVYRASQAGSTAHTTA